MPFKSSDLEPMSYDFTAHGGPKGVVPEPSQQEFRAYTRGLIKVQVKAKEIETAYDKEDATEEDLTAAGDLAEQLEADIDKLVADLCHDHPTLEEVQALPFRVKNAFSKYLRDEFTPKA